MRAVFAPLRAAPARSRRRAPVNTVLLAGISNADGTLDDAPAARRSRRRVSTRGRRPDRGPCVVETPSGIVKPSARSRGARGRQRRLGLQRRAGLHLPGERDPQRRSAGPVLAGHGDRSCGASIRRGVAPARPASAADAIVLNTWAARELRRRRRRSRRRSITTSGIPRPACDHGPPTSRSARSCRSTGLAADRRLAPEYPGHHRRPKAWRTGIRRFRSISSRVRPDGRGATGTTTARRPRRSSRYERGRELWRSRYGALTSLRFVMPVPARRGRRRGERCSSDAAARRSRRRRWASTIVPARAQALEASAGATDFGEYFTYFSFFIVVSALLLVVLFFKLGVEQRLRQIGILRASGFTIAHDPPAAARRGRASWRSPAALLGVGGAVALRQADRLRPADLVGRRGRHDPAARARVVAVAGRPGGRRRGRGGRLRVRLAAGGRDG